MSVMMCVCDNEIPYALGTMPDCIYYYDGRCTGPTASITIKLIHGHLIFVHPNQYPLLCQACGYENPSLVEIACNKASGLVQASAQS